MARFTFRLQSVLNLKTRLEDQQRNVFAMARRALDEEESKLALLEDRLYFYEDEGRAMRNKALNVRDIIENEEAIVRIKEFIFSQQNVVKECEEKLEEERIKLVEMIKERKMYERLRERAFEAYLEEEKHSEGVMSDEHNSYVYGIREA